jgi:hypothetical protein
MEQLYELLKLPATYSFTVRDLQMNAWGQDLIFYCAYQSPANDHANLFTMAFHDCREIRWRVYAHLEASIDTPARIVDLKFGRGDHRSPANILTSFFGLTISYGTLTVEENSVS